MGEMGRGRLRREGEVCTVRFQVALDVTQLGEAPCKKPYVVLWQADWACKLQ